METGPAPLSQILEEEYVALHGPLPREYQEEREGSIPIDPEIMPTEREQANQKAFYKFVHQQADKGVTRSALCLSGGGIRSATFNLGILQRLAELNLLKKFDYVSTVSGGGYLGSWLSAWTMRHPEGLRGVTSALRPPEACEKKDLPPEEPEAPEIRHLRRYSRYLAPVGGLFSIDTWTLVALYLRNLLLNWLVIVPLILVVLATPRLCISVLTAHPRILDQTPWGSKTAAVLNSVLLALGILLAATSFVFAGLSQPSVRALHTRPENPNSKQPTLNPRKKPGLREFVWTCWLPYLASGVLLSTYWFWVDFTALETLICLLTYCLFLAVFGTAAFSWRRGLIPGLREAAGAFGAAFGAGIVLYVAARLLEPLKATAFGELDAASGLALAKYVCLAAPLYLLSVNVGGALYIGFTSGSKTSRDEDREWWARYGAWILVSVISWIALAGIVFFGPALLISWREWLTPAFLSLGGASGLATLLLSRSRKTSAGAQQPATNGSSSWWSKLGLVLAAPIFVVFLTAAFSTLTTFILGKLPFLDLTNGRLDHFQIVARTPIHVILGFILALALLGLMSSLWINLNKFSMHGMYRDRLIRAYLGASRGQERAADSFTGFDPEDNIYMYQLRPEALKKSDFLNLEHFIEFLSKGLRSSRPDAIEHELHQTLSECTKRAVRKKRKGKDPLQQDLVLRDLNQLIFGTDLAVRPTFAALPSAGRNDCSRAQRNRRLLHEAFPDEIRDLVPSKNTARPVHVVNMAMNLIRGIDPAWQERKAESFTVSALHCGSSRQGYRDSFCYGGPRGISLGTAMTISGAAVSPHMGYYSSRPIAFLMTLFNVRLGWWLGNPGSAGNDTCKRSHPKFAIKPLIFELLGLADDKHEYVYLSDGGHFENLGLYEMVRRRCHMIVLGDGGRDPKCWFSDLGNAVRKIRIDMGIPITFENGIPILARTVEDKTKGRYCALATIDYKAVDGPCAQNGVLLYIKPAHYGSEPADVVNYASSCDDFPHESTADQFFSESQFESYRALGHHAMAQITKTKDPVNSLQDLFALSKNYLEGQGSEQRTQNTDRSQVPMIKCCAKNAASVDDAGTTEGEPLSKRRD